MSLDITYEAAIVIHTENDGPMYLRKGAGNIPTETLTVRELLKKYTNYEKERRALEDGLELIKKAEEAAQR